MDEANVMDYKSLPREIKYVVDTKNYCFQMKLEENLNVPWELCGYSDTDCVGDNDNQKIVTVYIVLLNRIVMVWISLSHKIFTLSITGNEYSSVTEICYDMLFFSVILLFMEVFV